MLGRTRRGTTLAGVLEDLSVEVGSPRPSVVAVIAADRRRLARMRPRALASSGVQVVELVAPGNEGIDRALSRYSGSGLVVVDTRHSYGPAQLRAFRQLFLHLAEGDVWLALRSQRVPGGKPERLVGLARLFETRQPRQLRHRWRELRRSTGRVLTTTTWVAFEKAGTHLLKLRDRDATAVLAARESELRVREIGSLPSGSLSVAGVMIDHGGGSQHRFPDRLDYPEARIRVYEGPVSQPTPSLALHGRSVLPDSFRWHLAPNPTNRGLRDIDARFAQLRAHADERHLTGSYYFFGYNHPGHFGHLMTEAVAKLWGWDAAKADDPSLKILCKQHPQRPRPVENRLENLLLPAYGIDPGDIVWAAGPVVVDRLVGVTPLWHNSHPYYVHPALTRDWDRLRKGLPSVSVPPSPKIFVTRRRRGNRVCRNGAEVEALFARHGFAVVRPETIPVPEQAALFAQAEVVAGFGGSGMFNLLFADVLETLIVLNQSAYWGRSEHLFAAALGVDSHFFWSDPDPGHPDGSYEAHQASWTFDFDRNAASLTDLLRSL